MPGAELLIALEITPGEERRLDQALLEVLQRDRPALTRAELKRWFHDERILYRGRAALPSQLLTPGRHEVEVRGWSLAADPGADAPPAGPRPSPGGTPLRVLHEDETILVLDKPSGMPSAPQRPDELDTAVNAALAHFPALAHLPALAHSAGGNPLEPGLLHRLDTGTSGALAFAKTAPEFARLKAAWKSRDVRKIYRAIVAAREPGIAFATALPLTIDWALGHDARSSRKMLALEVPARDLARIRGKPFEAVTHLLAARDLGDGRRDLTIELETGVMHQIRCHLAALRWPIVGDSTYRGLEGPRLWLHAWKLELPRADGSRLQIEAPLPEGWPT